MVATLQNNLLKMLLSVVLIAFVMVTPVLAEKLTVLSDDKEAVIFLDGREMGKGSVHLIDIPAGKHHIKKVKNGVVMYSKEIMVYSGEANVLSTDRFVDVKESKVPSKGPRMAEEDRLREAKGNIGIGGIIGASQTGLSFKGMFWEPFGIQLIGYDMRGNESFSNIGGRLVYNLKNKLVITDKLYTLYVGVGALNSYQKKIKGVFSGSSGTKELWIQKKELFLGVEIPQSFGYINVEAAWMFDDVTKIDFSDVKSNENNSGLGFNLAFHFYF